jgi:hemerythrin-like metal-binding protein
MPEIQWEEQYSVNIAIVNEQHKKIIELLNRLSAATASDEVQNVIEAIVEEVVTYSNYHFTTEELLMTTHGYPEYEEHRKEHDDFRAQASDFQKNVRTKGPAIVPDVIKLLTNWLDHHIMTVDKKYGPFLNERGIF